MRNRLFPALMAAGLCWLAEPGYADDQRMPDDSNDDAPTRITIVTAQKRAQSMYDVPASIAVVNSEDLDNNHAATLTDMQQLVPNFSLSQIGGANTVSIRGVGGGGRHIGFDTRVGVYMDGVYMGQTQALDQSLLDVRQIEVLRGPQGSLYGRNTDAGAVNIVTRAPSRTFESTFRALAGNYGTGEASGSISGPLSDGVQGSLAMGYESRHGYTTNLFNKQTLDGLKRASLRGKLAVQPTDGLDLNLSADYTDIKQNAIIGEALTGMFGTPLAGGLYPPHTVNYNISPSLNNTLSGLNLTANYDMPNGNRLTSVTGYRDTRQNRRNDTDWSPLDVLSIDYTDNFRQLSQEIRIASPAAARMRYLAGIYLLHENAGTNRIATAGTNAGLVGVPAGTVVPVWGSVKTDSYALFGSLEYDLGSSVSLNLGARYTNERKSLLYNLQGGGILGIGNAQNYTDSRSDSMLTPSIGLTWTAGESLSVYGKYSTGFKSGGWNFDYLTASQIANQLNFNKETVQSYELGLKGSALRHRVQYSLAAFHSNFRDYQVFQFVNTGVTTELELRNAARVETVGAEASLHALLTRRLGIGANIGSAKAVFKSFPGGLTGGGDAAGKRLPYAPDLTASLTLDYSMPAPTLSGRLDFYGEYSYRGKSYSSVDNIEATDGLSSSNLVNAHISFDSNTTPWKFSLWARNLFNRNYSIARGRDFFGNLYMKRGAPRTWGVEASYSY